MATEQIVDTISGVVDAFCCRNYGESLYTIVDVLNHLKFVAAAKGVDFPAGEVKEALKRSLMSCRAYIQALKSRGHVKAEITEILYGLTAACNMKWCVETVEEAFQLEYGVLPQVVYNMPATPSTPTLPATTWGVRPTKLQGRSSTLSPTQLSTTSSGDDAEVQPPNSTASHHTRTFSALPISQAPPSENFTFHSTRPIPTVATPGNSAPTSSRVPYRPPQPPPADINAFFDDYVPYTTQYAGEQAHPREYTSPVRAQIQPTWNPPPHQQHSSLPYQGTYSDHQAPLQSTVQFRRLPDHTSTNPVRVSPISDFSRDSSDVPSLIPLDRRSTNYTSAPPNPIPPYNLSDHVTGPPPPKRAGHERTNTATSTLQYPPRTTNVPATTSAMSEHDISELESHLSTMKVADPCPTLMTHFFCFTDCPCFHPEPWLVCPQIVRGFNCADAACARRHPNHSSWIVLSDKVKEHFSNFDFTQERYQGRTIVIALHGTPVTCPKGVRCTDLNCAKQHPQCYASKAEDLMSILPQDTRPTELHVELVTDHPLHKQTIADAIDLGAQKPIAITYITNVTLSQRYNTYLQSKRQPNAPAIESNLVFVCYIAKDDDQANEISKTGFVNIPTVNDPKHGSGHQLLLRPNISAPGVTIIVVCKIEAVEKFVSSERKYIVSSSHAIMPWYFVSIKN